MPNPETGQQEVVGPFSNYRFSCSLARPNGAHLSVTGSVSEGSVGERFAEVDGTDKSLAYGSKIKVRTRGFAGQVPEQEIIEVNQDSRRVIYILDRSTPWEGESSMMTAMAFDMKMPFPPTVTAVGFCKRDKI